MLGAQTTDVRTTLQETNTRSGAGLSAGVLAFVELDQSQYLRVGALASERKFEVRSEARNFSVSSLFLEVPISYLQLVREDFGWFVGARLGVKMTENNCTLNGQSCPGSDVNSVMYGAEVGGHLLLNESFGLEASYILGLSNLADDIQFNGGVFVAGFMII